MAKRIPLGDAGQIGEHHERVVERVVLGVWARQQRRPTGVHGTEHVVVGEKVVKPQVFDRFPEPPHGGRVSSKLVLRVDDAYLHGSSLPRLIAAQQSVSRERGTRSMNVQLTAANGELSSGSYRVAY